VKVLAYIASLVLIMMGVTNTVIRFTENAHKYGPILLSKLSPVYPVFPFVVRRALNPYVIGLLFVFALPVILAHYGSSDPVVFDPISGLNLSGIPLGF
jgi:hypothetical protein